MHDIFNGGTSVGTSVGTTGGGTWGRWGYYWEWCQMSRMSTDIVQIFFGCPVESKIECYAAAVVVLQRHRASERGYYAVT